MNTRLSIVLTVALCTLAWPVSAQAPRGGRAPRVVSPEVHPDRKITFRIVAPKAESVRLGGSDLPGLAQAGALTRGSNDVWEVTIGPVEPGAYRYHFTVDGVAVVDPRNPVTSQSNENTWSLVHVPGAEFMDTREVPHGAVAQVHYYSSTLQRFRRLHVYTPPGYEAGQEKLPVFYLLHGASDSDNSWSTVGRAGFILDNLIASGKAKPMVVVMPAGHTGPFRMGGSTAEEFEKEFMADIMPLVEKRYRVQTDRAHRAIAGLSMGGAQTLNIAAARLDQFAWVGVFSSGVFSLGGRGNTNAPAGPSWEERHKAALDNPELKKGLKLVWFATGKEDFLLRTSQATVEMLRKHQFEVVYHETPGAHTWANWRDYLQQFAALLFQ